MDYNLKDKVNKLNALYLKKESGKELSEFEMREQLELRQELINYFHFAITKRAKK